VSKFHFKRSILQDGLFLSLIVLLSAILYIKNLGFYSSDWAHLADSSHARSYGEVFWSLYTPDRWIRPVFILYVSGLYWLFGLNPLGYHLVNTVVILAGAMSFYVVLLELGQSRSIALVAPVLFMLLPHYSTDLFWYSSFQIPLSMATYFLSLYSDLRTLHAEGRHRWAWKFLAILSLLVSTLSYEIFLPVFLINPLLVWYRRRQLSNQGSVPTTPNLLILMGPNMLALAAVMLFKAMVTTRMQSASLKEHVIWFLAFLKNAVVTTITGEYGLHLPVVLWRCIRDYSSPMILVVGVAVGLITFWYLVRIVSRSEDQWVDRVDMFKLMACGVVIFGLGYSIFLTNFDAAVSMTGMDNHTAMAAAVGLALLAVGGIGWMSTWLPVVAWRRGSFYALISLGCASGFIIINTLALFWSTASHRQETILSEIRQHVPPLPAGSTLVLDGVCPYVGPAPVFEGFYDLTGALHLIYQDQTLKADIVTPKMEVRQDGLYTTMYGESVGPYPYRNLFVYNYGRKETYLLADAEAARTYLQTFNPDRSSGCPWSLEGQGELLFVKGAPKIDLSP
jgi:hypothetical protein